PATRRAPVQQDRGWCVAAARRRRRARRRIAGGPAPHRRRRLITLRSVDPLVVSAAEEIAARAERELEALVGVSSPSGDVPGADEALALCAALLPAEAQIERVPSSTPGSARDLVARIPGRGGRRMMLLGHVDTVINHAAHGPLRRDGERLYGPGTVD